MEIRPKRRPVFVIGTGRCGTTLLTDLIQGLRIDCLKERQVQSRFPQHGNQHLFNLLYRGDIPEPEFLAYFHAVRLAHVSRVPDHHVYCEKIPHGQWAVEAIRRVFPTARFIEIWRDGRDTVQSMLHAGWYAPGDTRPRWEPRGDLEAWRSMGQFEKCCLRLHRTIPFTILNRLSYDADTWMGFPYEELTADPEPVLRRIEAFAGEELYRGRVEVRRSGGRWRQWTGEQWEVWRRTLGPDGLAAQRLLGYGDEPAPDEVPSPRPPCAALTAAGPEALRTPGAALTLPEPLVLTSSTRASADAAALPPGARFPAAMPDAARARRPGSGDVTLFLLVRNHREFTRIALDALERHTNLSLLHRLVFVNDGSTDGADRCCHDFVRRTGFGEVVDVRGGTVTNALHEGSRPYVNDPVAWYGKLDNDMVVSEEWLEKLLAAVRGSARTFDVVGFTTVNEFFPTAPDELWAAKRPEEYSLQQVGWTGGNFLMRRDAFLTTRGLGVTEQPENYIAGSLSELHRDLAARGELRVAIIRPHLPVFKLDKVAVPAYDEYAFFERRGLDREWIGELVDRYHDAGYCRKRRLGDRVVNTF